MKRALILLLMMNFFSCKTSQELPTVKEVNLQKYAGTWYEIARLPNRFEKDLTCISATYTLKENGEINVLNQGHLLENSREKSQATGKAWVPDLNYPGRLKVQFFWPFAGDYYIIHLDDDYQYVLVGSPNRKFLWVLSKTKQLEETIYNELLSIAKEQGFDVSTIIKVKQDCD